MSKAAEVSNRLRGLYGEDPARTRGVLHAVASWRAPDATLRVIRIRPESPQSEPDRFALRAARMRADALVTTGKILRDEPEVQHTESDEALLDWRREYVGRSVAPRSVVLSSGRGLDLEHPLLRSGHEPLIVTGEQAAIDLRRAAESATSPVEVVSRSAPGLRDTLGLLRERGCETILIEAGPTTAIEAYEEPALVDELLLSVYEAPELDDALVGPAFLDSERLAAIFPKQSDPVAVEQPSGRWTFSRWIASFDGRR